MDALKEYTIQFTGLKDGSHEFRYELGDAFFQAASDEEIQGGEVLMTVQLDKSPTMLVAGMHARGAVRVHCDHCNGLMAFPIGGEQRQVFHLNGRTRFEEDADDVVGLDPDESEVNLTHYFYECIRLSLPIRRVHPEGQCDPDVEQAMRSHEVEHEHAPDPRWAALNALKKKSR